MAEQRWRRNAARFPPFHLKVMTPEIVVDEDGITSLCVTLADGGPIEVRPGHAPLVAETAAGTLIYSHVGVEHRLDLATGVLWVTPARVELHSSGSPRTALAGARSEDEAGPSRLVAALLGKPAEGDGEDEEW